MPPPKALPPVQVPLPPLPPMPTSPQSPAGSRHTQESGPSLFSALLFHSTMTREEEFLQIQRDASLQVMEEQSQGSTSTVSVGSHLNLGSNRASSRGSSGKQESLTPSKQHGHFTCSRLKSDKKPKPSLKKEGSEKEGPEKDDAPTNHDEMA